MNYAQFMEKFLMKNRIVHVMNLAQLRTFITLPQESHQRANQNAASLIDFQYPPEKAGMNQRLQRDLR